MQETRRVPNNVVMKQVEQGEEVTTRKVDKHERPTKGGGLPLVAIQRDLFRRLVEACKRKELNVIRQLLGEHPELLNYHDKFHRNLLHYVSILVLDERPPADLNGVGHRRQEMLAECLDCFRYLAGKCEPKLWFQVDQDGLSILHLAVISCNTPLVREMLFNGTGAYVFKRHQQRLELSSLITALDKEHHSPLHWAVITNNLECVRLLIEHSGVQLVHQADLNGATPLHYATQTSDYPKYRQQLKQMLKNATSAGRRHHSSSSPATSSDCHSSASNSSSYCDGSSVETEPVTIITKRLNDNIPEGANKSDLPSKQQQQQHATAAGDAGSISTASSYNNLDILDFLAHLPGVNLECRDHDSRTPLLWAASSGNRHAILLLLQSGANYLCQDANNLGPLHCAASHGFTDCLECLLLLSASSTSTSSQINQPDNLNCTPLFYAVLSGNIDCVELLLDRGAKKDWQDVKGRTAAHFGALRGQLNTLKLLEAHGANLWMANKQGDLPLHYAIKSGRQQVVAWLLERSPYERPVNAINNIGRAPIHLAILKNNSTMVDFLIKRGANLNQLVKVRDRSPSKGSKDQAGGQLTLVNANGAHHTKGEACYHYETALDMARRLNQRECLKLLERNSAQSAASVLANRQTPQTADQPIRTQTTGGVNVRSLFDLQAADVASPIGFETSGSSAEPPVERPPLVPLESTSDRLPRMPARPKPMAEPMPQSSDSANSSAMSLSSVTSLRGHKATAGSGTRRHEKNRSTVKSNQDQATQAELLVDDDDDESSRRRPYRGGINYHNERINASIKCKLYENYTASRHSFPPLNGDHLARQTSTGGGSRHHRCGATGPKYHSADSLPEQMGAHALGPPARSHSSGQQEIITNVNVYTSSPCAQCFHNTGGAYAGESYTQQKCQSCSGLVARRRSSDRGATAARGMDVSQAAAAASGQPMDGMISETSDSTDATSETVYDDSEREELGETGRVGGGGYLPQLNAMEAAAATRALTSGPVDTTQQQQQVRYVPPSRSYTQHLPVILSAEEDRSTSGETVANQADLRQQHHHQQQTGPASVKGHVYEPGSPLSGADEEPRFDRSQRGRATTRRRAEHRYHDQVRSPVAEYIHARDPHNQRSISEARPGWIQQQQQPIVRTNYSQIRAKVDSHRNDSGLSSHFGDELDGSSTAGRRSKSWSSTFSAPGHQQDQSTGGQFGSKSPSDYKQETHHNLNHHNHHNHHQRHQEEPQSRSCSRQTIIKTRRLSVDSEELASTIEKSIRRYKQESKLFEELQNLKRNQIRSGRANEALLVKRLAEHFRQEVLQDQLVGLEIYRGPFTYQAYELYLYDQLKRLSQTNYARLMGARVPHKFTYQRDQDQPGHHQQQQQMADDLEKTTPSGSREVRDFLDEELKADQELQRVLNGDSVQEENRLPEVSPIMDEMVAIEPSGALEEIRVRRQDSLEPSGELEQPEDEPNWSKDEILDHHEEQEVEVEQKVEHQSSEEATGSQPLDSVSGELEELAAARLEKHARASSTGSSRRSSVEIEQEKLDKLPLRVEKPEEGREPEDDVDGGASATLLSSLAKEKERKQIEAQAIDLTSAILTDALGNVSRASSPILGRSRSQDVAQTEQQPREDESKEAEEEEDVGKEKAPTESRGRRRSVVNIGDKIEIVYHKVGIEIDTVAEDEDHTDEEGARATTNMEPADAIDDQLKAKADEGQVESVGDEPPEASQSEELQQGGSEDRDGSDIETNRCSSKETVVRGQDEDEEEETEAIDESLGDGSVMSPERRKSSIKQVATMDSLKESSVAMLRRASSPPAPGTSRKPQHDVESRRLSSPHQPITTADALVKRKIFNGFDLDSLHEHRRRHQQQQAAEEERRRSDAKPIRQARRAKKTSRPRRPRSRLPEGPYRVYVPVELIRQRWNEVKQYERERHNGLHLERSLADADDQTEPDVPGGGAATGLLVGRDEMSHAKSQPNLTQRTSLDESQQARLAPNTCSNFILIYELNKPSSLVKRQQSEQFGNEPQPAALQATTKQQINWCQRRVTRIVDVRTLKRTLSLPESLIYSNELLKRFNLLKL